MAERLEVHALANPDAALRYALLTDWADAEAKEVPGDEATLDAARQAIRTLNERSRAARAQGDGAPGGDRFFLLYTIQRFGPLAFASMFPYWGIAPVFWVVTFCFIERSDELRSGSQRS